MSSRARSIRLVAALSAALMLSASIVGLTGAAATPIDQNADGITNLASCYVNTRTAAVNLLIDQSGSLRETDPAAKRVELAKAIDQAFAFIAQLETERKGRIDLAVSGFGSKYERVIDWGTLDQARADANSDAVSSFAGRNNDRDTDYVVALSGARADLIEHAAAMRPNDPASVCKVVVWFTDGRFSIDSANPRRPWAQQLPVGSPAERQRVVAEGERVICAAGGEADAMRQADIYLVTLALTSPSFGPAEEGLLKRITDGSAEPACGVVPAKTYGKYFNAGGVDELLLAFWRALHPPLPEVQRCKLIADRCVWSGKVEPLAVGMSLLIKASGVGKVTLLPPGSDRIELTAGGGSAKTADGDEVTWSSALGLRQVEVALKSSQTSAWSVELAPAGPGATMDVYETFRTGLRLDARATSDRWRRGKPASIDIHLVGPKGEPIPADGLTSVDLTAALSYGGTKQDLPVTPQGSSGTEFTTAFEPTTDNPAASATVSISGTATTAKGTQVPVAATVTQAVVPGIGPFPKGPFDLGVINVCRVNERNADKTQDPCPIRTTRTIEIEATGGAGTLCLADGTRVVNGPNEYALTAEEPCVHVDAGTTIRDTIRVRIQKPVAGALTGTVAFTTKSDEPGAEVIPIEVPVKGQIIIDPPDPYTDGALAWGLIGLGLLIPALLWAASVIWLAGYRRSAVTALTATTVPVIINRSFAEFTVPPASDDSIRYVNRISRTRIGFDGLTVRAPFRFFGPQDAIASRPGYIVHGSGGAARGDTGRIAHQLQGQWIVSVPKGPMPPDGDDIVGELHLLITIDAIDAEREPNGLVGRAGREIAAAYSAIRERLNVAPPTDTIDLDDVTISTTSSPDNGF